MVNYLQQKLNMKPKDGGEVKDEFPFFKGDLKISRLQVFLPLVFRGRPKAILQSFSEKRDNTSTEDLSLCKVEKP